MYSFRAKNFGKDLIYQNRLRLIDKLDINVNKNSRIYNYYMEAYLGIVLID